jgi:hypothetical protein
MQSLEKCPNRGLKIQSFHIGCDMKYYEIIESFIVQRVKLHGYLINDSGMKMLLTF